MSKTNLKIYAKFPTWETLSESVKSLINFFMKNGSMVFRGDYQNTTFQYMSGNVRNKYYSSFNKTAEHWNSSLELNIPYFEFNPVEEYPVVDGFPDGNSTVSPLTSSLELLELSEDGTSTETDLLSTTPIPVVLTPKSGEVIVNNPRLKPKNIKTNYNHIVQIPIDTEGLDFVSDFQIRTSSFYIDDGSGNIDSDVFYKIGICPFSDNSLEGLVDVLKDNLLSMKMGDFLFYKLLDGYTAVGKEYTEDSTYKFSSNIIFPLSVYNEDRDTYSYVGLAYIELCNQDGTLFNQDISDKNIIIYCRPSENESPEEVVIESGLNLTITDQSMEGGFIYTEYIKRETDDITKPLKFVSNQDGSTISFNHDGNSICSISYDGDNWESYSKDRVLTLNAGDVVYFKNSRYSYGTKKFSITGSVSAYNNVYSILRSDDFQNLTDLTTLGSVGGNALKELFKNCTGLTRAPLLPATVLTEYCYISMFYGCTSLTQAPKLPATTLAVGCYGSMFYGCSLLTQAPELPATTLANSCYSSMFSRCTSLTKAPLLPATILTESCYYYMFSGCTSLTQAPELPATTLANRCYSYMFYGCSSLEESPLLPATTLVSNCYNNMFSGCSALSKVRIAATNILTYQDNCLSGWLNNVAPSGDFYCVSGVNYPTSSISGIPYNWVRHDIM